MAAQQITGNESFWGALKGQLNPNVLKIINASQTLVSELQQYGAAVTSGSMQPMQISLTGSTNLLQFTGQFVQFGANWLTWSPDQFVGNLSHEIGHFANFSADQSFYQSLNINPNDPNAAALYDAVGLHAEGEAVFNNWKVQQEIAAAIPGEQIYINGDSGANGPIDKALSALNASNNARGIGATQNSNALIDLAGKMFSNLHPSDTPTGTTYSDLYAAHGGEIFSSMGISAGTVLPGAIAEVDFSDPNLNGNFSAITEKFTSGASTTQYFSNKAISSSVQYDQFGKVVTQISYTHSGDGSYVANVYDGQGHLTNQDQFYSDGSEVAYQINNDGSQNARVYDPAGHETEYATFGANGKKTQDIFFDSSTGRETQENDYNTDGTQINHILSSDGTQTAYVFNAQGHETEQATFGTNGKMTQDLHYDATSGRLTQESDISADGSEVDRIYNANGTQTAYAFNAQGHETEQATFGTNGKMTQDLYYDTTSGRLTQENDFSADGSQVDHVYSANGTQTAYAFNAQGHETEQATFGTNGKMTQDLHYDATSGRLTQESDISADGSEVDRTYNANGTQTAYAFNAQGHETEQATFGTNGKITQDLVFDPTSGRELQETDYDSSGGGVAHVFNADGTQNAAVFDPSGHVSEYTTYGTNRQIVSDSLFDKNGNETQRTDYAAGGETVHVFNPDGTQTAAVYNDLGREVEFAQFNSGGQKTDDYFYDGSTGREKEYDHYGNDGSMVAHLFNSDNSQNAIIFNGNGQEMQYDSYDASGKLTGFTQFTYGAGGSYDAIAYGPTGYELGWADYGSGGQMTSYGGGQYDFTLDDDYGSGSDWDWGTSFNNDYGFTMDFGW